MRPYRLGAHTKSDLKVHPIWIPKYRKRVLTAQVAIRARDILRQIAVEHELAIITVKISSEDVQMFIGYRPTHSISKIVQWLKGIISGLLFSEFAHMRNQFWVRHFWARGYLAISSGNLTGEMIQEYIEVEEGEPFQEESRLQIAF